MEDIRQRIVSGEEFTVFMYDLDNFKRVNDTYGHNTGDEVLREVALRSLAVEDGHFTPYRLAGDEFVALIDCGDYRVIERYASGLMERLQKPCRMGEADETLGVSLGIADVAGTRSGCNGTSGSGGCGNVYSEEKRKKWICIL
ncbi:MAG: GGDEF domain-containing protein [Roseburia sp.]